MNCGIALAGARHVAVRTRRRCSPSVLGAPAAGAWRVIAGRPIPVLVHRKHATGKPICIEQARHLAVADIMGIVVSDNRGPFYYFFELIIIGS